MYDIRQFKPALYALLSLGMAGFCLASGSFGLFLLAFLLIGFNARLVRRGRFRPVPRIVANLVTIIAGGWTVLRVSDGEVPVEPIGLFLVALQLVKLYEQRGNRDYGQLIVLSLLTMIASAMLPGGTSLVFGMMFLVWVLLSLYTCLLFHLKVETDAARRYLGRGAFQQKQNKGSEDADAANGRLRQDQRRLGSSLRRLTVVVAAAGIVMAVVVFLGFPRGGGQGFLHDVASFQAGKQSVTGFSGSVDFQTIARIQQNESVVAHVVTSDDFTGSLYLRGNALDLYQSDPTQPDRWSWSRSAVLEAESSTVQLNNQPITLGGGLPINLRLIEQQIELLPTGSPALFTLAGPIVVRFDDPPRGSDLVVGPDGTLSLGRASLTRPITYTVLSSGRIPLDGQPVRATLTTPSEIVGPLNEAVEFDYPAHSLSLVRHTVEGLRLATLDRINGGDAVQKLRQMSPQDRQIWLDKQLGTPPGRTLAGSRNFSVDPRVSGAYVQRLDLNEREQPRPGPLPASDAIIDFALDPDVVGTGESGESLSAIRVRSAGSTAMDGRIAMNMERHLRRQFSYSLDITADAAALPTDVDPLGWFVTDVRRGHCELFAGTMATALQSIGIPARVVVGFRSEEYNNRIGRWTVRQSHAHAWVEALTMSGWRRYDPTPAGGDVESADVGFFSEAAKGLKEFGEYLQYAWQTNVVAYDQGDQEQVRDSLFARVDRELVRTMGNRDKSESSISRLKNWFLGRFEAILSRFGIVGGIAGLIATVAAGLLLLLTNAAGIAILYFATERLRLRRRARRIGLSDLPPEEQRRLAKQLGFYDDLVRLLEREGLRRQPAQTPREFAADLAARVSPPAFDAITGLTDVFYRIRFGDARVSPLRRRLLGRVIERLEQSFI